MLGAVSNRRPRPRGQQACWRGFTLLELIVVLVVAGVLIALAAPSFRDLVLMQRLRATSAQLTTDFQFARSEGVQRSQIMRIAFGSNSAMTCYVIYTAPVISDACNCLLGPAAACASGTAGKVQVRTVQVPVSLGVRVLPAGTATRVGFDWRMGNIVDLPSDSVPDVTPFFRVDVKIDDARALRHDVNRAGRVQVCAPPSSTMTEPACVP
jgi:type IV fimbrial biogenesis protein FimT